MTNFATNSSGSEHREAAPNGMKVLIIEDDAGDFGLVAEELQYTRFGDGDKGPNVTWAKTLAEGLADAHAALHDVILLDLSLPDSTGVATLESVVAAFPSVPVVVFTSSDNDSLAIDALNRGAQDYLVKGQFDRYALKRSIRFASIRGQMERRLKLFESALNSAADGIEITDSTGRITWVNHAYLNMTRYNSTEVIGRTAGELLKSGTHDPAIYEQMWQTIASGKVWRGEVVNKRKDGSLYHEMLNIAPVISAEGTIRNFVATKQDITQRHDFELRLKESEQRLDLALASSDLGMWDLDLVTGQAVTNARWHEIIGYSADEKLSSLAEWEALIHPEDRDSTRLKLDAYISGDTPSLEYEYRIRHKEGHWVWILVRGKIVSRDEDGKPLRIVGTNLDITNQQRVRQDGTDLLQRIEAIIRNAGERPGKFSKAAFATHKRNAALPPLSERQIEVLKLVAAGYTSVSIAERLNIKTATVVSHRRDLMYKLDLHSVAELTRYAIELGIIAG